MPEIHNEKRKIDRLVGQSLPADKRPGNAACTASPLLRTGMIASGLAVGYATLFGTMRIMSHISSQGFQSHKTYAVVGSTAVALAAGSMSIRCIESLGIRILMRRETRARNK